MSSSPFLEQLVQPKQGINFLVPTHWLLQFKNINKCAVTIESLQIPELKLKDFADTFLLDFQSHLIQELEEKSNFLKFNRVRINLQINPTFDWSPISPQIWRKIKDGQSQKQQIITILNDKQSENIKQTKQVQIIFCSKTRSDAFVGYMPKTANLVGMIREIGFDMGFIEVDRSKIIFMSLALQKSYTFHEIEDYSLESAPDSIFMAYNMERKIQEEQLPNFLPHHNRLNQSNEAVVGDLNTMEDDSNTRLNEPIRNRTISTGAETPFSFALSDGFDLDRQYRVNQLFGTKQPQEIQEMKQLASSKINNQAKIIQIPSSQQKTYQSLLQRLVEEILQGLNKKRSSKQKQIDLLYE